MHREYQPSLMASGHAHDDHHHHDHDHAAELRALVATTVVVGILLGLDLALGLAGFDAYRRPFGVSLALLAAVIGGGRVIYLALAALLEGRVGADIALAVACVAAGLMGEYFVAAEVVFIALVGECLEAFTFDRAQRSIQGLLEYRPRTARVLKGGEEVEIARRRPPGRRPARRPPWRADRGRRGRRRWQVGRRSGRLDRRGAADRQGGRRPGLHRHGQPVRPARDPGREGRHGDDARPGDPPARPSPAQQVAAGADGRPLRPDVLAGCPDPPRPSSSSARTRRGSGAGIARAWPRRST